MVFSTGARNILTSYCIRKNAYNKAEPGNPEYYIIQTKSLKKMYNVKFAITWTIN